MNEALIIIAIIIFGSACLYWQQYRAQKFLFDRNCTGIKWKKEFPDKSKDEIREFLNCLVEAFAISKKLNLKVAPGDRIVTIYESIYGGKVPYGDQMECETFIDDLSNQYGISPGKISEIWHEDLTLGEMYRYVSSNRASAA